MAVLGVDVGLKSLSICIVSDDMILKWGVYNILDSEQVLCEICGRKAKYKQGFCGIHFKGEKLKKNEIKTKKVKSFSLQDIAIKIIDLLDDLTQDPCFLEVEKVIIELQPKCNPKMCFCSNVIFTKLCDYYKESEVKIKFERASVKLKKYKGDKGLFVENTYSNRKKKSIEYVECQIKRYQQEMQDFFTGLKKKDDASDSFLLAFNNLC